MIEPDKTVKLLQGQIDEIERIKKSIEDLNQKFNFQKDLGREEMRIYAENALFLFDKEGLKMDYEINEEEKTVRFFEKEKEDGEKDSRES